MYTYMYIYEIRIWHLTAVKSHKVQLEARHSSKQSDFEKDFEGKTSMVERAFDGKRSIFKVLSKERKSMLEQ